jgi:uncharacterized cupredoxin-like copper-binding protein
MFRIAAITLALAVTLSACANDSAVASRSLSSETGDAGMAEQMEETDHEAMTSEFTISLTEFGFDLDELDLVPGETVRFYLINTGEVAHEFRLTTEHKAAEHIAAGHSDHVTDGHHAEADIVINVGAGQTRTVETTLPVDPAAIDQLVCLIPGHYEAGMLAEVTF